MESKRPSEIEAEFDRIKLSLSTAFEEIASLPADIRNKEASSPELNLKAAYDSAIESCTLADQFLDSLYALPWPSLTDNSDNQRRIESFNLHLSELNEKIYRLPSSMQVDRNSLRDQQTTVYLLTTFGPHISDILTNILESHREIVTTGNPEIKPYDPLSLFYSDWKERFKLLSSIEQVRRHEEEASKALQATKQAAGQAGATALGAHFGRYAKKENELADKLRIWTTVTVITITLMAGSYIYLTPHGSDALQELAKLSIAIPLGLLAAYLGRESSKHRNAGRWASEIEIQLHTFDAFIAPLPESRQIEQRADFARKIFAVRQALDDSTNNPGATSELSNLLGRLSELIKSVTTNDKK